MAEAFDYLYIVEWDDSLIEPPVTVIHGIKLDPEVSPEDFENSISFSEISTRSGNSVAQYLLTDSTFGVPGRFEMLDLDIKGFGKPVSINSYRIVKSWKKER